MSTAAQEEVDRLFNQKERYTSHPEDRDDPDDKSSSEADDEGPDYVNSDSDSDTYNMVSRPSNYHIPTQTYDANTGPKGVIADAQSYERAKKRSFRRTLMGVTGMDHFSNKSKQESRPLRDRRSTEGSPSEEDEEFMRMWREARLQELQQRSRSKTSPSRRTYGTVEKVDANGYLDAIEGASPETVVCVCIYDPESTLSSIVEDSLVTIARKNVATRFIKLHHEIAEMENVTPPALIAYKRGDVFASIMDIISQLPSGRDLSPASLEDLLKLYRIV
ncbi:phosducin [Paecilomyces variotii]|uniref:Phosducin n=1 Tax=Byssochlamys spectabilis TaxID=264951 RepID=A0A443HPT5_BYSSP|nr:phosducin [Paecilomyces variotii]KAJ9238091.1 hypothetical protein DTO169E5_4933 [Paecilomyces variotii]KAJ9258233.1 hypothetical protein DTO195F2_5275 [Paecilomyces variotii]KAJ9308295.1 hypothetical protein DTO217A2_2277 [Paecilomyces variotii]KAJ9316005.1 hypothetical protein DTO271D3_3791 [Paecilomyces variotii]KAJ9353759.1 hypothetical protein DTO280E4_7138 [Paecilomyces variotii]